MSLIIDLLGPPTVSADGFAARPPRGHKTWGLLAYLLLTGRPSPRERIAALLFAEADDPLRALRWNLSELRRTLGAGTEVGGEPLSLTLPADAQVDVEIVLHRPWAEASRVAGLGRELLEGVGPFDDPTFETWLAAERRRFAGISGSILREAASARLAAGDAAAAVELAARLVEMEDFDEEAHALLIRAYVAGGDLERARAQSARSAAHLRDELGVEPSATLARALEDATIPAPGQAPPEPPTDRGVDALIEAGRAAFNAGAGDAGIQTLRKAVSDAATRADAGLVARAQVALGAALVHLGRGRDGEGATVLHAALAAAADAGDERISSQAARELGYIEFLRGRYDRAEAWLLRAITLAPDESERGEALGVLGCVLLDQGHTGAAVASLSEAAAIGATAGKAKAEGFARANLGRALLLRRELDEAREEFDRVLALTRTAGWISFTPFPQALRADIELIAGRTEDASDAFEAAFAVGCQIGDPCWEGLGARGIGLVHLDAGRIDEGFRWLEDATARSVRLPDAYLWIQAYCLDALCEAGRQHGHDGVDGWARELEALASRTGMREMLVRSHLHRAALGDRSAADAATLLAEEVDNPALRRLVADRAPALAAAG